MPFTVVLLQPPSGLSSLVHRVRLVKSAVAVQPPPPKPAVVEPEPTTEGEDALKAKKKLAAQKGKKQRPLMKGKRKAKAVPSEQAY